MTHTYIGYVYQNMKFRKKKIVKNSMEFGVDFQLGLGVSRILWSHVVSRFPKVITDSRYGVFENVKNK